MRSQSAHIYIGHKDGETNIPSSEILIFIYSYDYNLLHSVILKNYNKFYSSAHLYNGANLKLAWERSLSCLDKSFFLNDNIIMLTNTKDGKIIEVNINDSSWRI